MAYRASRLVAWIRLPDRPSRAPAVLRVNAPLREGGREVSPQGVRQAWVHEYPSLWITKVAVHIDMGSPPPQGTWVPVGTYGAPASIPQVGGDADHDAEYDEMVKVTGEWDLVALAYNCKRLHKLKLETAS